MGYSPGAAYYAEFATSNPSTAARQTADDLPVATANRNGVDDAEFVLVVTLIGIGRYTITGTVPVGYSEGDRVWISVTATVTGQTGPVSGGDVVDWFTVDVLEGATLAAIAAVAAEISNLSGTGGGSVLVDQDYGAVNQYTYETSLALPVQDGRVRVYLTADIDAGRTGNAYLRGTTTTDAAGHWRNPLYLDPGAYTIFFDKPGIYEVTTAMLVVVA
jgi:hypothetical protein